QRFVDPQAVPDEGAVGVGGFAGGRHRHKLLSGPRALRGPRHIALVPPEPIALFGNRPAVKNIGLLGGRRSNRREWIAACPTSSRTKSRLGRAMWSAGVFRLAAMCAWPRGATSTT